MYDSVHDFPKGISPKVKVIARLGIELAYHDAAVQHISNYTSEYCSILQG